MTNTYIADIDQYTQKDLAKKYKSTAGSQEKTDEVELARSTLNN